MPATCSRCYDLCPARLIFDLVDQILGDLDREIVFLGERAECPCHSTTCCVEHRGFPPGQPFGESSHECGVHDRFGMAMRMNRNLCRTFIEMKRVWFLCEQVIHKFFK